MFKLSILLVFFPLAVLGESLWLVGDDFISLHDVSGKTVNRWAVSAQSWAIDSQGCRLWVQNEAGVSIFKKDGAPTRTQLKAILVSDQIANSMFLRDGTTLIRANGEGIPQERSIDSAYANLNRLVPSACGYWGVQRDERANTLALLEISHSLKVAQRTVISDGHELWSREKILPSLDGTVWVGYSASRAHVSYAPKVELVQSTGDLIATKSFSERGLFLDACVLANDNLLIARDVSSQSGFTVPVFSHLESMDRKGNTERLYTAEVNRLIDTVACVGDSVYTVQRPLLRPGMRAGNPRLLRIDLKSPSVEFAISELPGRVHQIYFCEGGSS